ncbi:plasmid partitioning protein RepB [Brucella pseudogrignonensis]|uniref:ParB family chromosome partitioning protein n=1 Tax=Brucella pseudogrignonensis TaxID=419475 RepID=A0ABU1MF11_9HYPH|nr:plasmid partitioning protein RepB [Brucella pseudogrignonensis]MDR6434632.1 ParB family chromosome partitioning protein [Brucella pseudogrignonensis]
MAKKTLIQFTEINEPIVSDKIEEGATSNTRKKFDGSEVRSSHGYVSELSRSLQSIDEVKQKASEYETKQAEGQVISALSHDLIDFSFVKDRIDVQQTNIDELAEDISAHGQQSPILVRPHPDAPGRYQIVYGHRRYLATQKLGIPVQALIKSIDDKQLVIVQGQENSSRENLSFIEKALFGLEIRKQGFAHEVIMSALNVSSSMAYRYLKIAEQVTPELIYKIGPAPSVGRRPWTDLSEIIQERLDTANDFMDTSEVKGIDSDERFQALLAHLTEAKPVQESPKTAPNQKFVSMDTNKKTPESKSWRSHDNSVTFSMNRKPKKVAIELASERAGAFGEWLSTRLDDLYGEFEQADKQNGD